MAKEVLDADEMAWRARDKRWRKEGRKSKESLTDRAMGCVTCICGGWADVHFWNLKKKSEQHWVAICTQCWRPGADSCWGRTRKDTVAAWNQKNERWT